MSHENEAGSRTWVQGGLRVNLMAESFIQMMMEIEQNHPALWAIVSTKPDIIDVLAETGAYLGLAMEGSYSISRTCDEFFMLLRGKGSSIILPVQGNIQ